MSDSYVNNQIPFQQATWSVSSPIGSYDTGLPAEAGTGQGKTANPEKLALAFLAKMSEAAPSEYGTNATQGVNKTKAAQNAQNTKNAKFNGQSFTATMPPPTAPRVQYNANTLSAYQSFASESQAAMQGVGNWSSQQPNLSRTTQPLQAGATPQQAAAAAANWYTNAASGTPAFQNGSLAAFMKLRVENTDKSVNALEQLSDASSDLQGQLSEEQAAASKASAAEAAKAQKKSGILGVFQKVFAVVIAIVCCVAAFFSANPGLAALGIALAVGAFVVAGAVKGGGKGFNFWGGLDWFNNVAGVFDGALLIKAVAKEALKLGPEAASKAITETFEKMSAKVGEAAGTVGNQAAKGVTNLLDSVGMSQMEEAAKELAKRMGKTIQDIKGLLPGEVGTQMNVANAAVGVGQGAAEIGKGTIQFMASNAQASADADMANFKLLKSMVTMLDSSYKSANDLVQTLVKSHSNAVDTTQSMLKGNADVMNMISANMAQI